MRCYLTERIVSIDKTRIWFQSTGAEETFSRWKLPSRIDFCSTSFVNLPRQNLFSSNWMKKRRYKTKCRSFGSSVRTFILTSSAEKKERWNVPLTRDHLVRQATTKETFVIKEKNVARAFSTTRTMSVSLSLERSIVSSWFNVDSSFLVEFWLNRRTNLLRSRKSWLGPAEEKQSHSNKQKTFPLKICVSLTKN